MTYSWQPKTIFVMVLVWGMTAWILIYFVALDNVIASDDNVAPDVPTLPSGKCLVTDPEGAMWPLPVDCATIPALITRVEQLETHVALLLLHMNLTGGSGGVACAPLVLPTPLDANAECPVSGIPGEQGAIAAFALTSCCDQDDDGACDCVTGPDTSCVTQAPTCLPLPTYVESGCLVLNCTSP